MPSRWISAYAPLLALASAQNLLYPQTDTFASNFTLTAAQKTASNLTAAEAHNVEIALRYERSNYADGASVTDDPFYRLPASYNMSHPPPPGTIIKLEEFTNTTTYTIPPTLTMSRFLYTTEALNGSSVPASAYILWPYQPRRFQGLSSCSGNHTEVYPIIGLAHGTSGQTVECAPSHIRSLWDEFHEPFPLALAGYAIVAPDYAGLGVAGIPSPYFILPSQANDLFRAIQAAQNAFPSMLSSDFVLMGQSQGGAVAWSAAQRQAQRPVEGYLGTVAVSPFTNVLDDIEADAQAQNNARVVGIAQGLDSVLPSFKLSDWLTDAAIARHALLQEIGGCGVTGGNLFGGQTPFLKDGWNLTSAAMWYKNTSDNGDKPFAGPMLVLQGDKDPNANVNVTANSVNSTCAMFPENSLHYTEYSDMTHVPTLYAGYHTWLDWIADRFNKVHVPRGCVKELIYPARGRANGGSQNWFVEYDLYGI